MIICLGKIKMQGTVISERQGDVNGNINRHRKSFIFKEP